MLYPLSYGGEVASIRQGRGVDVIYDERDHSTAVGSVATYTARMPEPKVLIVDDDPVIQLLLRVNMEMEGFVVSTAGDGEEALRLAAEVEPDLMLLDVVMPKLDGFGVLEALRADGSPRFPVILLSAKSAPEDEQAGIEAGADLYVTKPFDPPELIKRIKDLLQARSIG